MIYHDFARNWNSNGKMSLNFGTDINYVSSATMNIILYQSIKLQTA